MTRISPVIDQLVDALQVLPGVGPKSALRMALHLLQKDKNSAEILSESIIQAVRDVGQCAKCRTLTEETICYICANSKRDSGIVCVVESSADVVAIESTAEFDGRYYVLHGRLSPIDGVGPEELGLNVFRKWVLEDDVKEVILATNPTVEGEATAYFITEALAGSNIAVSRIAHGVPIGGELGYVDGGTLSHALKGRTSIV